MPHWKVIKPLVTGGRYKVVDPAGDAELGNWVMAECWFEGYADLIRRAVNIHDVLVALVKRSPCLCADIPEGRCIRCAALALSEPEAPRGDLRDGKFAAEAELGKR